MKIETTRFGEVEIHESDVVRFPLGLLGFPERTRFAMLLGASVQLQMAGALWLQSLDDPSLAFVIAEPQYVGAAPLRCTQEAIVGIGCKDGEGVMAFVILNMRFGRLTANLGGPLLINERTMVGVQDVVSGAPVAHPVEMTESAP